MFFVFHWPSFQHLLIKWGWWNILDLIIKHGNVLFFFDFPAFQHLLTERLNSFCTQDSTLQNDGTSNKFLLISFICFHFVQKQTKSVKHWNFKQNWCLRKIIIFFLYNVKNGDIPKSVCHVEVWDWSPTQNLYLVCWSA